MENTSIDENKESRSELHREIEEFLYKERPYRPIDVCCDTAMYCASALCVIYDKQTCSALFHQILEVAFELVDDQDNDK